MARTASCTIAGRPRTLGAPSPERLRDLGRLLCPDELAPAIRLWFAGADGPALEAKLARALLLSAAAAHGPAPAMLGPQDAALLELGRALRGLIGAALAAGDPGQGPKLRVKILDRMTAVEAWAAVALVLPLLHEWSREVAAAIAGAERFNDVIAAASGPVQAPVET